MEMYTIHKTSFNDFQALMILIWETFETVTAECRIRLFMETWRKVSNKQMA